jgi:hypothetical protein
MKIDKAKQLITKMIKLIKPNGVLDIIYNLTPLDINGVEYYMSITYVVPDDSEYLRFHNTRNSDDIRIGWNKEIRDTIRNYFGVVVIINQSGITSVSYYNKQTEN